MKNQHNRLPQVAFSILLALSDKSQHGYGIIQQVKSDSEGRITLSAGALYASLQGLDKDGLIQEFNDAERKKYELTETGRKALSYELEYYHQALKLAHQRLQIEGLR